VLTVSVAAVPGITEVGLIEHVGASAGVGETAQVSATALKNPFAAGTTFTLEVDDAPGLTAAGMSAVAESEKSELNVAPTDCAELIVRLHVPLPEQPPLQPTTVEPVAGAAVSVTIVPGAKNGPHKLEQSMPRALSVTVPLPKNATVRGKF
jgi:hypothetical protein